jgi:MFS family permease
MSYVCDLILSTLSGVMFAPALRSVLADFGSTSETLAALCISIFVAGYAIGPLVWAPLSELYGRRIINNLSNILFLGTEIASGAAPSLTFLIIVRFLGGLFSSARFVLGGAIINDVIDPEHQGKLMAILNFGGTVCSVFGPMVYVPEITV